MNPTLKQTREDDQTAKENKLRRELRESEAKILELKKRKKAILIELGKCMVERIDDES